MEHYRLAPITHDGLPGTDYSRWLEPKWSPLSTTITHDIAPHSGSSCCKAPGGYWRILAAPGGSWRLLARSRNYFFSTHPPRRWSGGGC